MKRLILLATLLSALILSTGCGDGVAYTRRERQEHWAQNFDEDMHQLNDDWDLIMLNDRPSRLSRWR
jgi:hypothetical protein